MNFEGPFPSSYGPDFVKDIFKFDPDYSEWFPPNIDKAQWYS